MAPDCRSDAKERWRAWVTPRRRGDRRPTRARRRPIGSAVAAVFLAAVASAAPLAVTVTMKVPPFPKAWAAPSEVTQLSVDVRNSGSSELVCHVQVLASPNETLLPGSPQADVLPALSEPGNGVALSIPAGATRTVPLNVMAPIPSALSLRYGVVVREGDVAGPVLWSPTPAGLWSVWLEYPQSFVGPHLTVAGSLSQVGGVLQGRVVLTPESRFLGWDPDPTQNHGWSTVPYRVRVWAGSKELGIASLLGGSGYSGIVEYGKDLSFSPAWLKVTNTAWPSGKQDLRIRVERSDCAGIAACQNSAYPEEFMAGRQDVLLPGCEPTAPPTDLRVEPPGGSGARTIRWTNPAGSAGTLIEVTKPGGAKDTLSVTGADSVSYTFVGGEYAIRARAWSVCSSSVPSISTSTAPFTYRTCGLTCVVTAPAAAATVEVGQVVTFTGTATPSNCAGTSPAVEWVFGDGGSATQPSTSHVYSVGGDRTWTFRATIAAENAACEQVGTIRAVYGVSGATTSLYPGVASAPGVNNTLWRSQTYLVNTGGQGEGGELRIVPRDQSQPVAGKSYRASLDPGAAQLLPDLYQSVGVPGGGGALQLTGALQAWVRTFNLIGPNHATLPEGTTFGQDVPPYLASTYYEAGEEILFPVYVPKDQLTAPRSNFLIQSLDSAAVDVTLRIGGQQRTESLGAGVNALWSSLGARLGVTVPAGQSVVVGVLTVKATGKWNGYISTIDPYTGDPTTVRGLRPSDLVAQEFPGVANAKGTNNTQWKSEVVLHNPQAQAQSVLAELIPKCDYTRPTTCLPTPAKSKTYTLSAGQTVRVADLYLDMGAGEGSGTLRLGSGVLAWVRTYNQGTEGSYGQDVPGMPETAAHLADEQVWFAAHLPADAKKEYRSNLLLQSLDSADQVVTVRVGTRTRDIPVPRHAYVQVDSPRLVDLGTGDTAVVVRSTGRWNGTVSLVDPHSGDPTTLRGVKTARPLQVTCGATPDAGAPPFEASFACTVEGGTFPYRYAWSFGDGGISTLAAPRHTYQTSGSFGWSVTVTDSTHQQKSGQGTVKSYSIVISPAAASLSAARGTPYSQAFTQSGGQGAISWSQSGTLPGGLTFAAAPATLSGTPTQEGSFPITVKAKDANNVEGTRAYTLVVSPCTAITLSPSVLGAGTAGVSYSGKVTAAGGASPYAFSVGEGRLPVGLSLGSSTGQISGTPQAAGSSIVAIKARDANGCEGSRSYNLMVFSGVPQCGAWASVTGTPPTSRALSAAASNGSVLVVVGESGTVLRNVSGTWTTPSSPSGGHLGDVLWDGQGFVAVGYAGTVMTSPDGAAWTKRVSGLESQGVYLWGVARGGSRLVAVGGSEPPNAAAAVIITSDDGGVTWVRRTAPVGANRLRRVVFGGGRFVAAGTANTVLWSSDGVAWNRSGTVTGDFWDVEWGGGTFVAVGYDRAIASSLDGNTWVARTAPAPVATATFRGVAWNGSQHTVVGGYGTILVSSTGATWAAVTSPTGKELTGLTWAGSQWLALGVQGVMVRSTCAPAAPAREITVTLPGNVPLVLVRIPAGTFQMGSPADERGRDPGGDLDETQHQVTLTHDFYLGKTEVTQRQWQAVMGAPMPSTCGSHGVGDSYPMYCVSWDEVARESSGFLAKLNAHLSATGQPGAGMLRMPTEAEWERAARGGTVTRFAHGDGLECGDVCESCALHAQYMWWCGNNTPAGSQPVGLKASNGFGLFDMHGNVWEWVQDWYGSYPSGAVENPQGAPSGTYRVIRGGGWHYGARFCRSAGRGTFTPAFRNTNVGFRVARSS